MSSVLDEKTKKEIEDLVALVNKYNYYYHVLDAPIVSDKDYDIAYYTLLDLEKKTGYVLPDSPTQRVGDMVAQGFTKVTHEARLFSLDKAQSTEELSAWINKIKEQYPQSTFAIEYKFDGLRLALTYDGGLLVRAATRGNGSIGEDVTAQVKTIRSVPLSIPYKEHIVVEGEGIMLLSELEKYNSRSEGPLKNARNAVAGAIRNLDPKVTASRNLDFFAYGIPVIVGKSFTTQVELRNFLIENKFLVGNFFEVRDKLEDIIKAIKSIDDSRDKIDILIDGAVIKINEIPYNLMSSGSMIDTRHQNVIFELLFGLIVVVLFNSLKQLNKADLTLISNAMLIPILMYAAEKLEFDYGVYGVLLALLFGVIYGSKYEKYLIPVVISFVFIIIYNSAYNINILGLPIGIQWFAVIASIPLILYNKKKGIDNKIFKAVKYSFYPIHMLLLSLIILL